MKYSRNDCNALTEEMRQMFPKPLEKMYYNEIIDTIKKDKKYGFRHIALKIMVDGLEERTRDYKKYIDLQKEYFVLKQKAIVPKFRTYQPIFYITQYYTSTKGNPEYDIISDKYCVAENENEIILGWNYAKDFNQRQYYYVRKDWVFSTLEEAEQKLAEIKGEKL